MKLVKAPEKYTKDKFTIFLAGTIDMGDSVDWQKQITEALSDEDVLILNPRRDNWDSTWKQEMGNPKFNEQVSWELQGQEDADLVVFYFADDSKSPITMLELGITLGSEKPGIIYCSDKFYRKGNIDIVAERYGGVVTETNEEFLSAIKYAIHG